MNTRVGTRLHPAKAPMTREKAEMQGRAATGGKTSSRDRKMALQQDVDKLKKKLRHEENIHRALERALNRPLGALPRLPPFLPPYILALLAEVAVLEEEIVRLEEQVVDLRQDMYEEAVLMSSSKRRMEHLTHSNHANSIGSLEPDKLKSTTNSAITLPGDKLGKENQSRSNFSKSSNKSKRPVQKTAIAKLPIHNKSVQKHRVLPMRQIYIPEERRNEKPVAEMINPSASEKSPGDENPNTISENIVKCLSSILLRMSSVKNTGPADDTSSLRNLKPLNSVEGEEPWDPYGICSEFGKRDIGPYKQLCAIEAKSFNPKRTANSLFLLSRLKLLLRKLASVSLENLNYQEKLAFWINIYNSCMMNVFIENGVPESPEMVVTLMRKATINVGGYMLSATTIEHCILRLPYHWKLAFSKGANKNHEITARSTFGLELTEPLVTFALSCGTWSSPAVRVYSASQVENELEVAKREYLQAAIGISTSKFAIPKLLSWYLLDFAKDLESLLDWICLQLPSELGKEAINFLEKRKTEPLSQFVQILPYEFTFRYLICT
ncbi:hypothetical protein QN277_014777 [Acacia crassicarpa]|uniref:Ternary complex factor MIP1 leucine-zipper domain-containing protein n=1 Tax=Acacia crassicarpa TaxID=499986 RepID=A0AAE1JU74_9FABA|nr:hypothetical protein QN277_014777 [Acacia crassicarpa]